jgi:hypothetical protein
MLSAEDNSCRCWSTVSDLKHNGGPACYAVHTISYQLRPAAVLHACPYEAVKCSSTKPSVAEYFSISQFSTNLQERGPSVGIRLSVRFQCRTTHDIAADCVHDQG